MAADKKTDVKAPDWKTAVDAWKKARAAFLHADNELAKLMNEHDQDLKVAGVGTLTGVKSKGKDSFYVKVQDESSTIEIA